MHGGDIPHFCLRCWVESLYAAEEHGCRACVLGMVSPFRSLFEHRSRIPCLREGAEFEAEQRAACCVSHSLDSGMILASLRAVVQILPHERSEGVSREL